MYASTAHEPHKQDRQVDHNWEQAKRNAQFNRQESHAGHIITKVLEWDDGFNKRRPKWDNAHGKLEGNTAYTQALRKEGPAAFSERKMRHEAERLKSFASRRKKHVHYEVYDPVFVEPLHGGHRRHRSRHHEDRYDEPYEMPYEDPYETAYENPYNGPFIPMFIPAIPIDTDTGYDVDERVMDWDDGFGGGQAEWGNPNIHI
ncbi:hypothetical protein BU23DRAFT_563598 [Bimuria novae-zelandiae CBS 107.79]|uniref:Uncharacterized protein n=1 Tax=Bimuria novae-zelandiae CBS 107.79 TaxID=1447943 RepID=A0A6A5VR18_9PLEO|nr:hypothetical protein BU23DRAFT_563598 [Bimuria novae-zelandiae CBS 107.79]